MIQDSVTDEFIVPYDQQGTIVNCDVNGNYVKLDFTSLMAERYYKLVFRSSHVLHPPLT